jgi:hypothetical protein
LCFTWAYIAGITGRCLSTSFENVAIGVWDWTGLIFDAVYHIDNGVHQTFVLRSERWPLGRPAFDGYVGLDRFDCLEHGTILVTMVR